MNSSPAPFCYYKWNFKIKAACGTQRSLEHGLGAVISLAPLPFPELSCSSVNCFLLCLFISSFSSFTAPNWNKYWRPWFHFRVPKKGLRGPDPDSHQPMIFDLMTLASAYGCKGYLTFRKRERERGDGKENRDEGKDVRWEKNYLSQFCFSSLQ